MYRALLFLIALCISGSAIAQVAPSQTNGSNPSNIELRLKRVESQARNASTAGAVAFLFGVVCALWAQNTGRSGWLWFFCGLIFTVIAALILLYKNSADIDAGRRGSARRFNLEDFRRQ